MVNFPGRRDLEGQRAVVDSFYLKRDGQYRAKLIVLGQGRSLGVLASELGVLAIRVNGFS